MRRLACATLRLIIGMGVRLGTLLVHLSVLTCNRSSLMPGMHVIPEENVKPQNRHAMGEPTTLSSPGAARLILRLDLLL